jgi:hypothetical protein
VRVTSRALKRLTRVVVRVKRRGHVGSIQKRVIVGTAARPSCALALHRRARDSRRRAALVVGEAATFVTFRGSGSALRRRLGRIRRPGPPRWAGSPGGREEPDDRLEANSPPRRIAIAGAGTRKPRWPGGVVGWASLWDTGSARMRWWVTAGSVLPGVRRGQAESRMEVTASRAREVLPPDCPLHRVHGGISAKPQRSRRLTP